MSHFVVWVFGEDIEGQLAPYSERREVNPYPTDYIEGMDGLIKEMEKSIDFLEDHDNYEAPAVLPEIKNTLEDIEGEQARYLKWLEFVQDAETYEALSDWLYEWNGRTLRQADGMVCTTYNPDSKWDWYQVGGRWHGFFTLKEDYEGHVVNGDPSLLIMGEDYTPPPDRQVDGAEIRGIDFQAMVDEKVDDQREFLDNLLDVLDGEMDPDDEELSEAYKEALTGFIGFSKPETPAEIQARLDDPYVGYFPSPYAFVVDGEWIGKGDMCYFGMSDDEYERIEWNRRVIEAVENQPEDQIVTAVDCHI